MNQERKLCYQLDFKQLLLMIKNGLIILDWYGLHRTERIGDFSLLSLHELRLRFCFDSYE